MLFFGKSNTIVLPKAGDCDCDEGVMYTVSSMATGVLACQPRGWYTLLFPINALPIWEYIVEMRDVPDSVFIFSRLGVLGSV